ncbi:MAG: hypothetical protein WAU62_04680 [Dehalococcoidales bacterium]
MEEENKLRKLEMSTAEAHGAFALGLFSTALWLHSTKGGWVSLTVLGGLFVISSLYFLVLHKWKRQKIVDLASPIGIEYVNWLLGLVALGVGLIETRLNWAAIPGVVCICSGYAVLFFGVSKNLKSLRT